MHGEALGSPWAFALSQIVLMIYPLSPSGGPRSPRHRRAIPARVLTSPVMGLGRDCIAVSSATPPLAPPSGLPSPFDGPEVLMSVRTLSHASWSLPSTRPETTAPDAAFR